MPKRHSSSSSQLVARDAANHHTYTTGPGYNCGCWLRKNKRQVRVDPEAKANVPVSCRQVLDRREEAASICASSSSQVSAEPQSATAATAAVTAAKPHRAEQTTTTTATTCSAMASSQLFQSKPARSFSLTPSRQAIDIEY